MKSPECTNPQHPAGRPRRMLFLEEKDFCYVFACQACKDVNHKMSVRVISQSAYRRSVRSDLRKQGKLLTERPKTSMPQYQPLQRKTIRWNEDSRKSNDGRYELVSYRYLGDGNVQVQMAVDGKLAPMIDDHLESREMFNLKTDDQYFTRMAEASELMLHLYGDARTPLSPEESQQRQHQTY